MEGYTADPILVPKDSYAVRPLPLRIGTTAFKTEEDVGLGDYASDSEGEHNHAHVHVQCHACIHCMVPCTCTCIICWERIHCMVVRFPI